MNRADKVKRYRKMGNSNAKGTRKARNRKNPRNPRASLGMPGTGLLLLGVLAACICLFGTFLIHKKSEIPALSYVTQEEFASLMSFLDPDFMRKQLGDDKDKKMTRQEIRDFLQSVGLSDVVAAGGGSDRLKREAVMQYYDQIRDYLDVGEAVSKKTILCLKQSKNSCETQDGKLKFKIDSLKLKPMHTYEVYVMGKEALGVRREAEKAVALKNVEITDTSGDKVHFIYKEKEYEAGCKKDLARENTHCTLYIKGGFITEVKDVKVMSEETAAGRISDTVEVLLLNQGAVHYGQVYLFSDTDCAVKKGKRSEKYKPNGMISSKKLKLKKGECAQITPAGESGRLYLADAKGKKISNGYYGSFFVYRDLEGYYIVNKVNVEKYLYSVVASEMPSSFATEALKAQAVCARSYVCRQMAGEDYKEYHAQIDDSTNYQVYNKSGATKECIQAVDGTAGLVMYEGEQIVDAYYYSTSCGYGSGMEIWNQKDRSYLKARAIAPPDKNKKALDLSSEKSFQSYIKSDQLDAYDRNSKFFRWKATLEPSACLEELKERITMRESINPENISYYATRNGREKKAGSLKGFGGFQDMYCARRSKSGAVLELVIEFEFGKVKIKSEYNIRYIVGCAMEKIVYADGSSDSASRFLPSAYFSISFQEKSRRFLLSGGGNGHGIGMSQYGADSMARDGWDYKRILNFYYDGVKIRKAD